MDSKNLPYKTLPLRDNYFHLKSPVHDFRPESSLSYVQVQESLKKQFQNIFRCQKQKNKNPKVASCASDSDTQTFNLSATLKSEVQNIGLLNIPQRSTGNSLNQRSDYRNNSFILDNQKRIHKLIIFQDRDQKLQQLYKEQKKQFIRVENYKHFQEGEYNSQNKKGLDLIYFEDTEKLKVKSEINDYDGQLLTYPLIVNYLRNSRQNHASYIQKYWLGKLDLNPRISQQNDIKEEEYVFILMNAYQILPSELIIDSDTSRQSQIKRIKCITDRYSQQSPIFTKSKNKSQFDEITPRQDKNKKFKTLQTILLTYEKDEQKSSQNFKQRYRTIKKKRPPPKCINSIE